MAFEESEPMILCRELVAGEARTLWRKRNMGEMDDVNISF